MKPQCPECGHFVTSYFDHIAIDCEHDMTEEEIADLLRRAESLKERDRAADDFADPEA